MANSAPKYVALTFKAYREGEQWVSECEELSTASCGDTAGEALDAVQEATAVYLEALEREGELERVFKERGISVTQESTDGEQAALRARIAVPM